MIGKLFLSVVDYYDSRTRTTRRKGRPVLVIAGPRNNDYTVLPVSTITNRVHLDPVYDVSIGSAEQAAMNLGQECFIRTHKQMTIHAAALIREKGDMKTDFPELYLTALAKMEQYQQEIMEQAL